MTGRPLPRSTATDRDQVLLSRIAKIQHKVDSLEQTTAFALRADSDRHMAEVRKIFGTGVRRAKVYLAANGSRSVQEIAMHLKIKHPNVSVEVKKLVEEGLLEIVDTKGSSNVYAKTALARTLRIPTFLSEAFNLGKDGRRPPSAKVRDRRKRRVHK